MMAELGGESPRYHREIGVYARDRADLLIGVGELARHFEPDHWMIDAAACVEKLQELIHPEDCVFVKGSRFLRLNTVVRALTRIGRDYGARSADMGTAGPIGSLLPEALEDRG
jgi:UDP-N-acetylmuramoyl-tripeptide--D-alanyl-D-alanine ligase